MVGRPQHRLPIGHLGVIGVSLGPLCDWPGRLGTAAHCPWGSWAQSQAELVALERSFAAVTTLLISVASGTSCWAVGEAGSCLIVFERLGRMT